MTIAEGLQSDESGLMQDRPATGQPGPNTPFARSLRSKGYVFIILVLSYMLLATAFFFSQREKPLLQLEQYQKIQKTQAALVQADLAAFHVVTVLFAEVTPAEFGRVVAYFSTLRQQYQGLRILFPEQAEAFQRLEQSIPLPASEPAESYLHRIQLHLAESKSELERLTAANQARMTSLVREYRENDDALVIKSLVLGSLGLILIGTITTVFFNRLKSDLFRLQQRTTEIVKGYRGAPLEVTRQDEVGQLTDGINYMSQALAEREQALEIEHRKASFKDKMIAIDSLAGGIAHEIGNPITCIAGLAEEIGNDAGNRLSEDSKIGLSQLQQYIEGAVMVTKDLSQLDIRNLDESQWLDANQLLANSVNLCRFDNRWSKISLRLDLDHGLPAIFASEIQFNHMIMQLLENARDALSSQDQPDILVQTKPYRQHGISIIVEDNGIGVAEDELEHIFEPFYTTKAVGQGTGLGLAICWTIIKSHQGDIRAERSPAGGLKLILDLPCEVKSQSEGKQF